MAKRKPRPEPPKSLRDLVGERTYEVWLQMLHEIVPDSRTHRLGTMIAGLLQYAATLAHAQFGAKPSRGSLPDVLLYPEEADPEGVPDNPYESTGHPLETVVAQLFEDAGVPCERTNARGDSYSIVPWVVQEYIRWYDMPWE